MEGMAINASPVAASMTAVTVSKRFTLPSVRQVGGQFKTAYLTIRSCKSATSYWR